MIILNNFAATAQVQVIFLSPYFHMHHVLAISIYLYLILRANQPFLSLSLNVHWRTLRLMYVTWICDRS
jgi:hypothetical protein